MCVHICIHIYLTSYTSIWSKLTDMHKWIKILVAYLLAKLNRTKQEKLGYTCCLKTLQAQETEKCLNKNIKGNLLVKRCGNITVFGAFLWPVYMCVLLLFFQVWTLLWDSAALAEYNHDLHNVNHAEPVHQRPHGHWTQHQTPLLHRCQTLLTLYSLFVQLSVWSCRLKLYQHFFIPRLINQIFYMVRVFLWACLMRLSYKKGLWSGWTLNGWLLGEHQSQLYLQLGCGTKLTKDQFVLSNWARALNVACIVYCMY